MIDSNLLLKILKSLDEQLQQSGHNRVHLLIGGAGALIGAYGYNESTTDVDAIPLHGDLSDFQKEAYEVAKKFRLPADWINPHYSTFTIYLPADYRKRCVRFYVGENLMVDALGAEDLLIMKFMAGRKKDHSHIKFLLKQGVDLSVVESRLTELQKIFSKPAERALELFDDLTGDG